jgi:exonuclease SbcD
MVQCHEYGPGRRNILIGHWTISGSVASSGQLLYGGTEPVIPLAELQAMEWDAVLFGHIHKAQVLSEKPFIGYAGALERVDFGEEDDPRGCYIHDLDAGTYGWIDLPARRFHTISASISSEEDVAEDLYWFCKTIPVTEAIARVKYKVTEDLAPLVDHAKIMDLLKASAPEYIAGIFPEITRSERSREASVTEETGPLDALSKWLDKKEVSRGFKDGLMIVAAEMIKEVLEG